MKNIFDTYKTLIITIIVCLAFITIVRQCEKEPKTVVKTVTKTVTKHDTIIKTVISKPKTVYVNKYVNVKGETEIVYVKLPDSSTIKANQYNTTLNSNKANAALKITTTGELLDVSGVIIYPKETVTTTITKTSAKSGLFLYGSAPLNTNNISVEVGLLYQFKNTIGVMGGLQYNDFTKSVDAKIGLAVKIF
jgi:hypothetical protein